MKKNNLLYVMLLFLLPMIGSAQTFQDHFDYTPSETSGLEIQSSGKWVGTNSGIFVTEGSLPYSGLTGPGNKITLMGSADGAYSAFDPATTPYPDNVYYSFVFRVLTVPGSTEGDYFIRLNNGASATNIIVPIYIRASPTDNTKFNIGYGKRGLNQWLSYDLNPNTTYHVVVSYSTSDTDPNTADPSSPSHSVKLWLNPPLASFYSNYEPPYTLRTSGAATGNVTNTGAIKRVIIGHGNTNNQNMKLEIDEMRVGTTWSGMASLSLTEVAVGTYYIDSNDGNDNNDGLSIATAWKSLARVNSSVFKPGSKLLFKGGGIWNGQLAPLGSGESGNPIIIDKYGDSAKPLFDGNGIIANGVVKLFNQSFWEINNLEIVNDGSSDAERRGVEINASNFGLVQHIHLKNLEVHNIRGTIGGALSDKRSAGIYFTVSNDDAVATRYDDILVEGCLIYNCQNQGIVTNNEVSSSNYPGSANWNNRRITNLVIRNNVIHHISKNAMIIRLADGGLVEHNLCYETATGTTGNTIFSRSSRNTVFQYNEGYLNRALENGDFDGSLYDPDLNSPGTIWQYSYSHDNSDGLIVFCTDPRDDNVIARYNVSQNDKGDLVKINFEFTSAQIYNNTFYIGAGLKPAIIKEVENVAHTYTYQNNIVYNADANAVGNPRYIMFDDGKQNRTITNNIFYRTNLPSQINAGSNSTSDPLFVEPGTATTGLSTVGGYKLKPGSPALTTGIVIANNGGLDYFGNPVSASEAPNLGFYNGPGTNSALPVELTAFTGRKQFNGSYLTWQTASEQNNARFIIERSTDGNSFHELGDVKGAGNAARPLAYSFLDNNPYPGLNYYRLKQQDFDGTSVDFKTIVALDFTMARSGSTVQVYPNPAKDQVHVLLKDQGRQQLQATVYTMQGKQVHRSLINAADKDAALNVSTLYSGIYILEVRDALTLELLGSDRFVKR
ncbi:T9SS type A sorting domain-containing protein (plasmid) [Pedobacter sp. BS3]|uniref:T9SS type A sorting domain-containing protein n=1 Tax=Pedobacter sp. BS3 TaxID=2567937 RepID=UPI0011ECDDD8|nr:T9SS type A sorting domain-containing protein [Pedobacter sp. BS3]TZF85504.1 T9SS type A sorting domain-containing protein [Pedobacter sp. BS3]